jgi:hypothetical protein
VEALAYSARLRLPAEYDDASIKAFVHEVRRSRALCGGRVGASSKPAHALVQSIVGVGPDLLLPSVLLFVLVPTASVAPSRCARLAAGDGPGGADAVKI